MILKCNIENCKHYNETNGEKTNCDQYSIFRLFDCHIFKYIYDRTPIVQQSLSGSETKVSSPKSDKSDF